MTKDAEQSYITTRAAAALLRLSHNQAFAVLKEHECAHREINSQSFEWRRADVEAVHDLRSGPIKPMHVRPITEDDGRGDLCGFTGARRLKNRIEAYWRERGASVTVQLVEVGFVQAMRTARFDVRSDMLNGWPRESSAKPE